MARRTCVVAVALAILFGISAASFAVLTPGQKMAVEALIKQLSAAEFDVRQNAVDKLVAVGPDVVPLIQKVRAETADNEVKLRCDMVLKGIKAKYPEAVVEEPKPAAPALPAAPAPAPGPARGPRQAGPQPFVARDPGKFGFDPSKITLNVKDAELDKVLQMFAEQSGNSLLPVPKDWEGKTVTLDAADMGYWQALDKLCASLGLGYAYDTQAREYRLQPLNDTVDVSAYAGPVVVKLDSATLTKRYRTLGGGGFGGGPGREGLSVAMTYFTEDRLQPLEAQIEVTRIVGTDGKEIALDAGQNDPAAQRGRRGRGGRGFGGGTGRTGMIFAAVQNPQADVVKLAAIEGVAKLTFGTGTKELKVNDALMGANRGVTSGNARLTVARVQRMGAGGAGGGRGGRGGNGGDLTMTLKYEVDGQPADLPEFGRNTPYGFALVDPKGDRHTGFANAGGGFFMMGRGGQGGPGNNPNPPQAAPGTTALAFNNVPEIDGAWTLVITLPDQIAQKEFPFQFTNVSLR